MRYWEIDFLRGIGIVLMLISNFITDLQFFLGYPNNVFWRIFALFTASIFVFTSGASFYVSYTRKRSFRKIIRRFVRLMFVGDIITLVTYVLFKRGTIYFGILHFLATAWIIAIPFYYMRFTYLFAVLFILLYPFIDSIHVNNLLLLPIGITPQNFYTFDYFPIFPWFGIFLMGFEFGKSVMKGNGNYRSCILCWILCWLGRNSLKIYLLHQPIFVSVLLLLFGDRSNILTIKL